MQAHHRQSGGASSVLLKACWWRLWQRLFALQRTSAYLRPSLVQPFWVQLPCEGGIHFCTLNEYKLQMQPLPCANRLQLHLANNRTCPTPH